MENLTKESLYKLSIYQVRSIARDVGVRSPASLRKGELINKIIAISEGKLERFVPQNSKGRPPKPVTGLNEYVETLLIQSAKDGKDLFDSELFVCSPKELEVDSLNIKEEKEIEGILDIVDNGIGIIKQDFCDLDGSFVSPTIVKKNKLRRGDVIRAFAHSISVGKVIVDSIITINGKIAVENRFNFKDVNPVFPNKILKIDNCDIVNNFTPIGCGQRALVFGDNNFIVKNFITNLYNNSKCEKFLILFDSQPEEIEIYKNQKNIICFGNENVKDKINTLQLVVDALHRKAEQGLDAVLFVYGGLSLKELEGEAQNRGVSIIEVVVNNFKNLSNSGSCGLVLGAMNGNSVLCENVKAKAFNLIIPLSENLFLNGFKECINLKEVNLFRNDNLLKKEYYDIISKLKTKENITIKDVAECLKLKNKTE